MLQNNCKIYVMHTLLYIKAGLLLFVWYYDEAGVTSALQYLV